ncbi:hypothetical protein HQN90_15385 [Paenibacillus alba]|uniref:hypothetical protein n=1 Tax=Paenibacillus alba TaxID=1197127 RepID=UPI001564975D|nr:hypothetical protein [Paenibacillus alba]NQX67504.1 hypothetical protein [Paenibacillus alba]
MKNPVIGKAYTERFGEYRGITRILVREFRVYFEQVDDVIAIAAVLFPGEK